VLLLCVLPILGMREASQRPISIYAAGSAATFRSSPIAVAPDGRLLLTVNPDSNSISLIDTVSRRLLAEIPVGPNPQTVSVDPSGGRAYITNRDDATLSIVDLNLGREVGALLVGDEPFGVLASLDGRVYVSNSGSDVIDVFDKASLNRLARIATEPSPRGLALSSDQKRLYVTHFLSGKLTVIDTQNFSVETVISTGQDGNLSQAVVIDPVTQRAFLPQTRSNTTNGALLFDSTLFPIVTVIDLITAENLQRQRIALDVADRPVSIPIDLALTSSGKLYVVNAGSNDVSVIDIQKGRAVAHLQVGDNPRGMVLTPDQKTLYVNNTLSGSVSVIDAQIDKVIGEIVVTKIPLSPVVLNGKILFNTSARDRISKDHWMSCASCHFDGGMDQRTWFFRDGPRNTPSLLGVKDTLPIHWSGDLDELQDVEATIRNIQAGTGLADGPDNCTPACDQAPPNAGRSKDLDDLAAFMRTLKFRANPNLNPDGTLTNSARRGEALFFSSETRCAICHPPPLYTDRTKHDVGTGTSPLEAKGTSFDTPSLRGIYNTAPYLHDGSAATLLDVLTMQNRNDAHGKTSHLSGAQLQDLVQFLKSLPFDRPRRRP
jgi:YVTN family beta-propeller protein